MGLHDAKIAVMNNSMKVHDKKTRALTILKILENSFPDAQIELSYDHNDPWQLLVVVALSAQTTDKKVNEVSKSLFLRFKTVNEFAKASPLEIEPYIKSIGLYRNKAKNLVLAAKRVMEVYGGHIPKSRSELETLAGVGKKTSAVIVSNAFNIPALAVDTHVARIARRLDLTKSHDPDKIELELTKLFGEKHLRVAHHTLIFHGRRICFAKKPYCSICPINELCPKIGVTAFQ